MVTATERRRILFRLSLVLNVLLVAGPIYAILKGGSPLPARLADTSLDRAWHNAVGGGHGDHNHDRERERQHQQLAHQHFDDDDDDEDLHVVTPKKATPPPPPPPPPAAPPKECGICDAGEIGRALCAEWGQDAMTRAVAYSGTNNRLRHVLAKLRRGEPFSMGIIGGSVSAGHGMHAGGDNVPENIMHNVFFDHLNTLFPQPGGTVEGMGVSKHGPNGAQNVFYNGAEPARGSDYYSMCLSLHIPQDVDLVVVELAINDPPDKSNIATFENLLRAIYELPSQPAVLMVNVFALMFDEIAMGGDLNLGAAMFYDTPVVSARNALLPMALRDKHLLADWFAAVHAGNPDKPPNRETLQYVDLRHFGPKLHIFTGKLMAAYIDKQLCEMDRLEDKDGSPEDDELYPIEPIAPYRVMDKYKVDQVFPKLTPFCRATNSKEFPLTPTTQNGWEPWSWKDKKYLIAKEPGSKLSFEFDATLGRVILYYLRSYNFGLGNLKCWIDDDMKSAQTIEGHWEEPFNIGRTTTWLTTPGKHALNCELLETTADPNGGHEFRLMAIMSI